ITKKKANIQIFCDKRRINFFRHWNFILKIIIERPENLKKKTAVRYCQKKNCDPTPLKDRKKNTLIDILAKNTNLLKE
ncbi:hypothetical protein BpHYR1_035126, partial [Brachionus plicatilis]